MRIKTLLSGTLATLMVLCCAIDTTAQKRTTGKRTTSTRSVAKTTTTQSTGPAIASDYLVGKSYSLYLKFGNENQYMYARVEFESGNNLSMDTGKAELEGSWKISGNKVDMKSGQISYSLSSKDGGIMFKGTNSKGGGTPYATEMYSCQCRDLPDRSDKESWLKALKNGEYTAWARYYIVKDKIFLANPVKVKFVEDEDDPYKGTVKITGEGGLMEFLGSLKSEYNFGEKGLTMHFNDYRPEENCTSNYSDNCGGTFWVKLGTKQIPGRGMAIILLDFYHK